MNSGTLALACLWLALGQAQAPDEPFITNQRAHKIPATIDAARRAEFKQVILFASSDEGRSWTIAGSINPNQDHFEYRAAGDGTYRLKVASINQADRQEPPDPRQGPPDLIIIVDTARPIFHALNARRQGDEVQVSWQLQEEHPDWKSFRLEYQTHGAATWTQIQAQPNVSGQAVFMSSSAQPLTVRLSLRDRADNSSFATTDVAGNGSFSTAAPAGVPAQAPAGFPVPSPSGVPAPAPPMPSLAAQIQVPAPVAPLAPLKDDAYLQTAGRAAPAVGAVLPATPPQAVTQAPSRPVPPPVPAEKVVADSQWTPPPTRDVKPASNPGQLPAAGPAPGLVPASSRRLPPIQHVNTPRVTLEFEVSKLGPSGVGTLQLWCSKDDGQTWEIYAEDRNPGEINATGRQQIAVPLDEECIYGFTLVVKNRLGVGKAPPRPGDVPEMRIELDTTPPLAKLFAPEPDKLHPDTVLLSWQAQDKNPTEKPINLEWAARPEGPWLPIATDLPSNGPYSWQPGKDIPVQVYLRLRVRDAAGNESTAATREPQPIDLSEPEVHLINVVQPRR